MPERVQTRQNSTQSDLNSETPIDRAEATAPEGVTQPRQNSAQSDPQEDSPDSRYTLGRNQNSPLSISFFTGRTETGEEDPYTTVRMSLLIYISA